MNENDNEDDMVLLYHGGQVKNKKITKVIVDTGVEVIDKKAFRCCSELTHITIPASVTAIKKEAFYGCKSLKKVTIPDRVTKIEGMTFRGCDSLESINLPDSITEIGDFAFAHCHSLKTVVIPEGVTTIGKQAFANCPSLTEMNLPNSITKVGEEAFERCTSIQRIVIPKGLTTIGEAAFAQSGIEKVVFATGTKNVSGFLLFHECESLHSIELPASLEGVDFSVFQSCPRLKNLNIPNGLPALKDARFDDNPFEADGVEILSKVIANAPRLERLDTDQDVFLDERQLIDDENIRGILELISSCKTLRHLRLSGHKILVSFMEKIASQGSPTNLRRLYIDTGFRFAEGVWTPSADCLINVLKDNPKLSIHTNNRWDGEEYDKVQLHLELNRYGCRGFTVVDPVFPKLIEKLTSLDAEGEITIGAPTIVYNLLRRHSGLIVRCTQKHKCPWVRSIGRTHNADDKDTAAEKVLGMIFPAFENTLVQLQEQGRQMQKQMRQMQEQGRENCNEIKRLRLLLEDQQKQQQQNGGGEEGSQAKRARLE